MILTSPLVLEKVWLDKPKYDAAERRYYERLTKSLSSKTEVGISNTINSDVVCSKPELSNKVTAEGSVILAQDNDELTTLPAGDLNAEGITKSANTFIKDTFPKPTEEIASSKSNSPVSKKKQDNVLPHQKGEDSKKPAKEDINSLNKKEPNKCNLPSKSEKPKKNHTSPPKANSNSKVENVLKQSDSEENVCSKPKSCAKQLEGKLLEALQSNSKMDTNFTEQMSEVAKLKGYFLQSKTLFSQSDNSLTKGTNVNNIPELSKLTPCPEKVKPTNSLKKVNQTGQSLPPLDKQETTDLIIPTDISETQGDEQTKKDSKRKKRNKKERLRDKKGITQNPNSWNSLAGEVAKARQHIKNSLQCIDDIAVTSNTVSVEVTNRLVTLEKENQELITRMEKMEQRISSLEKALEAATAAAAAASRPFEKTAPPPKQPVPHQSNDDEDDGVDLFGSDSEEEDTEASKIKEQRLAEYAARKAKKPVLIAKSNIILDVKPWDDETDMKLLEAEVRKIGTDGLVWGASKLVPLAYGIHKLQISCVVEDEKVSVDWLQETIQEIEDYVQSVDIAAFNKV